MSSNALAPTPTNSLAAYMQRQMGFDPNVERLSFLPYPQGALTKGAKIDWSNWVAPQVAYDAAKAYMLPGYAAQGGRYTPEDAANMAMNVAGGGMAIGRAPANSLAMNVYHGTPHRFAATERNPLGEFRASQIGTGEGAQAYGHGLYLAEDRGLADVYRKKLTGVDGVPVSNPNDSLQMKIGRLQFEIDRLRQSGDSSAPAMIRAYEGRIKELNDAGSLYKVDLPDPMIEKMLHWDKPLSQQSKAVQEALKGIEKNLPSISDFDLRKWMDTDPLASTWHNVLNRDLGVGQPEIAALLQKKGVPGVQYFAAESRGSGGARNFVVFPGEEKNLTILKRE